jgi:hypothetical protein
MKFPKQKTTRAKYTRPRLTTFGAVGALTQSGTMNVGETTNPMDMGNKIKRP